MKCVIWMVDSGAEKMFAISLASLRCNAFTYWNRYPKLVLDFGLSERCLQWLRQLTSQHVHVYSSSVPDSGSVLGGFSGGGVGVMSRRTEITTLAPAIAADLGLAVEEFIVCDSDTVFMRDPGEFPIVAGRLSAMQEWDNLCGQEYSLRLCRPSSFRKNQVPTDSFPTVARQLGISAEDLSQVTTYNSGVIGFRSGTDITQQWRTEYKLLTNVLVTAHDGILFSPYAAEQNALALAIHKGTIHVHELPRRFNQFPPRPPSAWSDDTVIAHFITFRLNNHEARYDLWRNVRQYLCETGDLPAELAHV